MIDSLVKFTGYGMDAAEVLSSTFNGEGYDGIVLLRDIEFHSPVSITFSHSKEESACRIHTD